MKDDVALHTGDVVRMKKEQPCGSYEWEITRTGMDIGIKCRGCGHFVMLPRAKFMKSVRDILVHQEES